MTRWSLIDASTTARESMIDAIQTFVGKLVLLVSSQATQAKAFVEKKKTDCFTKQSARKGQTTKIESIANSNIKLAGQLFQ